VAGAIGVPLQALDSVQLPESLPELSAQASQLTAAEARRLALHSRADILAALSDYEASQAALRLQIARQYPNINLGPGYEYDQGENKIGFKLAAELPVFYRNQGPIAEAKALRDEAAARFTALQARILCDIDRALTALRAAEQQFATVNLLLAAQRQQQESVQKQLAAGVAEPLDLLNAQLELMAGELAQHDALLKRQQALGQLEDAIQRPLNVDVAADVKRLSTKPKSE
jgi:outer membrane protein TolC